MTNYRAAFGARPLAAIAIASSVGFGFVTPAAASMFGGPKLKLSAEKPKSPLSCRGIVISKRWRCIRTR